MKFRNHFILPSHTQQTAMLGLYHESNDNYNLLSHILLIFKYHIHISREKPNTKYRYPNSQFNKIKEKGEANKHWYHQQMRSIHKKVVHLSSIKEAYIKK